MMAIDERLAIPFDEEEAAREYRARFTDERPKCAICGSEIELFLDMRNEFPGAGLYWAHVGAVPEHKVAIIDPYIKTAVVRIGVG